MSGRNWLERDPKDSPGLLRIQEAQQAAAAAKAQAEQEARKAAIATQEAERKRLEMIARIEQKTAQVLPLLEEIRDFANETGTYPVGPFNFDVWNKEDQAALGGHVELDNFARLSAEPNIQLVRTAELHHWETSRGGRQIILKWGFKGYIPKYEEVEENRSSNLEPSRTRSYRCGEKDGILFYGITIGNMYDYEDLQILRQDIEEVPERYAYNRFSSSVDGRPKHTRVDDKRIPLPNDENNLGQSLLETFHNPVYLGAEELTLHKEIAPQPEPQASTGIADLVKGFLGLK